MLTVFIFLIFFFFNVIFPDKKQPLPEPLVLEGVTMGTTYRVLYFDEPRHRNFGRAVDSILISVNKSISTYDPSSEISRFNRSERGIRTKNFFFCDILKRSKAIYDASDGAFDPTVMPLVNAWGFGPDDSYALSHKKVDSLRRFIGFEKVRISGKKIRKEVAEVQLDMGGIGQGYGADVIFNFLKSKGVSDMLVELGGEGIASGKNLNKDKPWTIGILDPNSTQEKQFFKAYVELDNQSFTTSGNYFNYRIINGRKYGHTIDPASGYPVQHSVLSASVFARDCTTADGLATAFMVMGLEKAIEKTGALTDVEAVFMYADKDGNLKVYITPGIKDQVKLE